MKATSLASRGTSSPGAPWPPGQLQRAARAGASSRSSAASSITSAAPERRSRMSTILDRLASLEGGARAPRP